MSWTESTLRGAASWQAFKAGQSFCTAGAASVAKSEPGGWQGSVRDGRQLWRVSVRVISPTALETRCSCPDNQASGAVCAHAVAVGLAALRGSPAVSNQPTPVRAAPPPMAWDVLLAPNWRDALVRGRLAATLSHSAGSVPADPALSVWLAAAGGGAKSPLHLQLDGVDLSGFLEALTGHPRIFVGKDRCPLEIRAAGSLALREIIHQPSTLRLIPQAELFQWVILADHCWQLAPEALTHIGPGPMPPRLAAPLAELMAGHSADLPTVTFLATLDITTAKSAIWTRKIAPPQSSPLPDSSQPTPPPGCGSSAANPPSSTSSPTPCPTSTAPGPSPNTIASISPNAKSSSSNPKSISSPPAWIGWTSIYRFKRVLARSFPLPISAVCSLPVKIPAQILTPAAW